MSKAKILILIALLGLLTGCACKTRNVEGAEDNVPFASSNNIPELSDIFFDFDSYVLRADGKAQAERAAGWLQANSNVKVTLEGHCDERGTTEYNLALGSNRARSVYDYLRSLGIPAERMSTVSYGEELPLDPGHDETAWAKNRRVHFDVK